MRYPHPLIWSLTLGLWACGGPDGESSHTADAPAAGGSAAASTAGAPVSSSTASVAGVPASVARAVASAPQSAAASVAAAASSTMPVGAEVKVARARVGDTDPLRHRDDLPPEQRTLLVLDGEERIVDVDAARAAGYQIVDLTDEWTPFIFGSIYGADGEELENRYRRIFIGLANDETDGDGRNLRDEEDNYLEVFGIPPSLSVIRGRFIGDEEKACHKAIDYELLAKVDRVTDHHSRSGRKAAKAVAKGRDALKAAFKKYEVLDFEALRVSAPEAAAELDDTFREVRSFDLESKAIVEIDKRLDCDDHNAKSYKHKKGELDHGLRLAIRRFQRKHKIYEHTNLRGETMVFMGMPPIQTNWEALRRAMTERVVAATSILEDGSAVRKNEPITFEGKDGETHPVRNLVAEFTDAAMAQAGLDTPERALAFFKRHSTDDLKWLKVAIKFPPLPEYYGPHMDLDLVVDRGDVWYDAPFNSSGKAIGQSRGRMPKLYLYLTYNGQRFPLVRWGTTIGGWREEQAANGYLYYKYKGSDVGDRVIRKIIAGPTWVPPETTPLRALAKRKYVNGGRQGVVNYDEMGPGYLSAYGLVAGYFVVPGKEEDGSRDYDNGIRAHGSSDYMSIMSSARFSHGCHRLMNHQSVRLYGFLLNHRTMKVVGDQPINHQRQFLYEGEVFEVRLPSRGFRYDLTPPLPVKVLEGNIKGHARRPIEGFVKVPGKDYPDLAPGERPSGPDDRGGESDGGAAGDGEDT